MASAEGPTTTFIVTCATAVGAGILLGGFVAGLIGLVHSWSRDDFDLRVRKAGYFGGVVGLLLLALDRITT